MISKKININKKFQNFSEFWSPRVIAEMNDYQFKLAKIKGEFIWHTHDDTDEVFIVIEGEMKIELEDDEINLAQGDLFVVPRGIKHKPFAKNECKIMLVEPRGVINTGNVTNELTAKNNDWI